jgi:hypothetical protein
MATEAAWLEHKKPLIGRKKKNRLDTHRPSHGRHYKTVAINPILDKSLKASQLLPLSSFASQ